MAGDLQDLFFFPPGSLETSLGFHQRPPPLEIPIPRGKNRQCVCIDKGVGYDILLLMLANTLVVGSTRFGFEMHCRSAPRSREPLTFLPNQACLKAFLQSRNEIYARVPKVPTSQSTRVAQNLIACTWIAAPLAGVLLWSILGLG